MVIVASPPLISKKRSRLFKIAERRRLGHHTSSRNAFLGIARGRSRAYLITMKRHATLACLIAALLLSACAARPTPYMPRAGAFGYDQTQIDSRTWRVVFAGNAVTPRETVENYLLYRAAEIMLFGAHEKFIVLEKDVERNLEYRPSGPSLHPYPYPYPYPYHYGGHHGLGSHAVYGAPYYYAVDSYRAFATVRSYAGGPAPPGLQVYAAREVIARLGQNVVVAE